MKVVVIGGGPSGLICASLIAENGHDVTLVEKNEKVANQIKAAIPDAHVMIVSNYGYDIGPFIEFLHKIDLEAASDKIEDILGVPKEIDLNAADSDDEEDSDEEDES